MPLPDVDMRPLFENGIRHLAREVGDVMLTWCDSVVPSDHRDPTDKELKHRGIWTPGNCHDCHRLYRKDHGMSLSYDFPR